MLFDLSLRFLKCYLGNSGQMAIFGSFLLKWLSFEKKLLLNLNNFHSNGFLRLQRPLIFLLLVCHRFLPEFIVLCMYVTQLNLLQKKSKLDILNQFLKFTRFKNQIKYSARWTSSRHRAVFPSVQSLHLYPDTLRNNFQ